MADHPAPTPTPPRRIVMPGVPGLGGAQRQPHDCPEGKRMVVAREIHLSGQIESCDVLVVEGRAEASLVGARVLDVAEGGFFKGDAEIEIAEIAGRYEGELTVRDRVVVKATGRVLGKLRYRRLVVEEGGEINGALERMDESRRPAEGV